MECKRHKLLAYGQGIVLGKRSSRFEEQFIRLERCGDDRVKIDRSGKKVVFNRHSSEYRTDIELISVLIDQTEDCFVTVGYSVEVGIAQGLDSRARLEEILGAIETKDTPYRIGIAFGVPGKEDSNSCYHFAFLRWFIGTTPSMRGAGAQTPELKKKDGYSRVPLDALVVRGFQFSFMSFTEDESGRLQSFLFCPIFTFLKF